MFVLLQIRSDMNAEQFSFGHLTGAANRWIKNWLRFKKKVKITDLSKLTVIFPPLPLDIYHSLVNLLCLVDFFRQHSMSDRS